MSASHGFASAVLFVFLLSVPGGVARAGEAILADFEDDDEGYELNLGQEFAGAKGDLTRDTDVKHGGNASIRLEADFAGGGQYVAAGQHFDEAVDFKGVSAWLKTSDVRQITVRMLDAKEQVHQQTIALKPDGQWQELRVDKLVGGANYQHWGGPNDGAWHGPAQEIAFLIEKTGLAKAAGTLWIDDIRAFGVGGVGQLKFKQAQLGNVFVTGQPVQIGLRGDDGPARWKVRDVDGTPMAEGQAVIRDGRATLTLPLRQPGYYQLHVEARGEAATSLAVVPPTDKAAGARLSIGVCSHFAQGWSREVIPLIARAGIVGVRDEAYWDDCEKSAGKFAFDEDIDLYQEELAEFGLMPLVPLTFDNKLYDGGQTPHSDKGFDAYARYGAEVLRHYAGLTQVEVWNEYNGSFCKGPAAENRSATYCKMLARAYAEIKKTRPGATVVGGSTAGLPWPYLEKLFAAGGLAHMDVVSVHPYRYRAAPEGLETDMDRLATLVRRYNQGRSKPVWATEYGWFTKQTEAPGDLPISEADQAKFLVRGHLLLLSAGVEKAYWYLLKDTGDFPTMGLLRNESDRLGRYTPKPAYAACANLAFQLNGMRFVERERAPRGVYVLRFEDAKGSSLRAMWAPLGRNAAVEVPAAGASRTDMWGASKPLASGANELLLSDEPLFIAGSVRFRFAPQPGDELRVRPLADSVADFSAEQGKGGWLYGYFDNGTTKADRFVQLPQYRVTDWTAEWVGKIDWLSINADFQHPAVADGKPVTVVRRWVSHAEGPARLRVNAVREETQGDGVNLRILVDGKALVERKLGGGQSIRADLDERVTLRRGTTIDFAVDPGPAADITYDGTNLVVTIEPVKR